MNRSKTGGDSRRLGSLQHHLADENAPWIAVTAPGEISTVAVIPGEQCSVARGRPLRASRNWQLAIGDPPVTRSRGDPGFVTGDRPLILVASFPPRVMAAACTPGRRGGMVVASQ